MRLTSSRTIELQPSYLDSRMRVGPCISSITQILGGKPFCAKVFEGIAKGETQAVNSASLFRVSALKQIGGFNPYFWLDFQDAYVYRQLQMHGRKIYIAVISSGTRAISTSRRGSQSGSFLEFPASRGCVLRFVRWKHSGPFTYGEAPRSHREAPGARRQLRNSTTDMGCAEEADLSIEETPNPGLERRNGTANVPLLG